MTKRIAVLFSPEEAATLMELLRRERAQVRNTRQRPRTDLNLDPGIAPEAYVALIPDTGLPALSQGATTGTSSADAADDVPGSAECGVYRRVGTTLQQVEGLTRTVYNLMPVALDGGQYVLVLRDKWGDWYVPSLGLRFGECP